MVWRFAMVSALALALTGDSCSLAGQRPRQTLNFNIPSGPGGATLTTAWWVSQLKAIQRLVNGSETSPIGPAAHILFNLVGTPDAVLVNQTAGLLEAAAATRLPVRPTALSPLPLIYSYKTETALWSRYS